VGVRNRLVHLAGAQVTGAALPEPGVYFDVPAETYHAWDAISSGGLKAAARSAWHYKHRKHIEPTPAMLLGTLSHCAVLEPSAVDERYVTVPDDAPRKPTRMQLEAKKPSPETVAQIAWWRAFEASAAGREIVSAEAMELTRLQIEALQRVPELRELFASGAGEVSLVWIDAQTRLACKARLDWLNNRRRMALDLKTTADESPRAFGRQVARMRWDLQWAHYVAGLQAHGLADDMLFAAVTNEPPVLAVPYMLTDEIKSQARDERAELMDLIARCTSTDEWPAYGSGIQLLDLPAYAKRDSEVEFEYDV
jgi:exodeoxyribonuclease VIII